MYEAAVMVKMVLLQSIARLCANEGTVRAADSFSASDYLFVSTRVAREFPNLVESALVLSHETFTISAEQLNRIGCNMEDIRANNMPRQGPLWRFSTSAAFTNAIWESCLSLRSRVKITVTWILMTIGTQRKPLQTLIVNSLNPLLLGALGSIGVAITHSNTSGFLLIAIFFVATVSMILFMQTQPSSPSLANEPPADAAVDATGGEVAELSQMSPAPLATHDPPICPGLESCESPSKASNDECRCSAQQELAREADEGEEGQRNTAEGVVGCDAFDFGSANLVDMDDDDDDELDWMELHMQLGLVALRVAREVRADLDLEEGISDISDHH